jgi:transcriptional regulator with XRE-family HTH domain
MVRSRRPAPRRLGEKLLQIRISLGLSQTEVVKKLDYTESPLYAAQISNFEQGKREPPTVLVLAYARMANIPMELLVDDKLGLPDTLLRPSRNQAKSVMKKKMILSDGMKAPKRRK